MDQAAVDALRTICAGSDVQAKLAALDASVVGDVFPQWEQWAQYLRCYLTLEDEANIQKYVDLLTTTTIADILAFPLTPPPFTDAVTSYLVHKGETMRFLDVSLEPYKRFVYGMEQYDPQSDGAAVLRCYDALWLNKEDYDLPSPTNIHFYKLELCLQPGEVAKLHPGHGALLVSLAKLGQYILREGWGAAKQKYVDLEASLASQ